MSPMVRVVYIGANEFSARVLEQLARRCQVVAVGTYPDIPHGRGHRFIPTPVKVMAEKLGLPVIEIPDVSDRTVHGKISDAGADVGVVVSFKILPPEFLRAVPAGFVNLHPSLLPDLRGAAPVNWAIMLGYRTSGLTTFVLNERVDAGNILMQREFEIGENETAGEVFERIVVPGAELLVESLEGYLSGRLKPVPQVGEGKNKAPKIKRVHRLIRWTWDSRTIHNRIRGLSPVPGALTGFDGRIVRILRSRIAEESGNFGEPGQVLEIVPEGIVVAGGEGAVLLTEIQPEGKKIMDGRSFANGYIKHNSKFYDLPG